MKKTSLTVLVSLSMLAGVAYAQTSGISTSTDPAVAAEVVQRAEALQAQQQMQPQPAPPHGPMRHHKKGMKRGAPASQ